MGLSNEERFSKVVWSIHHILDAVGNIHEKYSYGKLKNLCENIWPTFLGKQSNSSFWLFGGDMDNRYMSGKSLISIAFEKHSFDIKPNREEELERREEEKNIPFHERFSSKESVNDKLTMQSLINDEELANVLRINDYVENAIYALQRYDDEFSEQFEEFNVLIRKIQGELFEIFQKDQSFYKVWLLHNIIDKCVNVYDNDLIAKWIVKENIHHDLRMMKEQDIAEMEQTYFAIQPIPCYNKIPIEERLFIIVDLCGRRFHYEHQHKKLIQLVEEHNKVNKKEKINLKKLQKILDWCKREKVLYDKASQQNYRPYCHLSNQEV